MGNHLLLFLLSSGVIWFFAGVLIDAIDRVAKRFNQSGFTVAFFVLGILTSISEISVAINASLKGQPQISAGNLAGASLVILFCIIPFLAIIGKGISLSHTLTKLHLALSLIIIALPPLLLLDGTASTSEGVITLLVYGTLLYTMRAKGSVIKTIETVDETLLHKKHTNKTDALKILMGAMFIFLAGNILVDEAVFFADFFRVPSSLIGLLLLSVGTNVPELVIAVRSIHKKRMDIAFGDYLGSALANTLVFGLLVVLNGGFAAEPTEFLATFLIMLAGLILFYFFAGSKNNISRKEGWVLLYAYAAFLVIQIANFVQLAKN